MGDRKFFLTEQGNARNNKANAAILGRLPTVQKKTRRVPPVRTGGAQIIQFAIDSGDCDAGVWEGTVTNVMCSGADVSIGDSVELEDPLQLLTGDPDLVLSRTGFAVKMEGGSYGCTYSIINVGDLGFSCG